MDPRTALAAVKFVHTAVWAVFAGCILWIPVAALSGRLWLATGLAVLVLVVVLARRRPAATHAFGTAVSRAFPSRTVTLNSTRLALNFAAISGACLFTVRASAA